MPYSTLTLSSEDLRFVAIPIHPVHIFLVLPSLLSVVAGFCSTCVPVSVDGKLAIRVTSTFGNGISILGGLLVGGIQDASLFPFLS